MGLKFYARTAIISAAVSAAAAILLILFGSGSWRGSAIVFAEFVFAAVLVPYFFCSADFNNCVTIQKDGQPRRYVFGGFASGAFNGFFASLVFVLVSVPFVLAVQVAAGGFDFGALAKSHLLLAAYAVLCAGLFIFFRPLFGAAGAQIGAAAVLLAAMAGPFWLNGFISVAGPALRSWLVFLAVAFNPIAAAGSAVFGLDVLRMKGPIALYDISNLGDYPFAYPVFYEVLACWVFTGAILGAVGGGLMFFRIRFGGVRAGQKESNVLENRL